jgi:GT2 family glycosyltransferase
MKTTAICIVNYNTRDLLRTCLHSVLEENPDEIIVVDNASTDGSAAMVKAEFRMVRLISLEKNIGYGAASNRAIEDCRADHILLLNADTILSPRSLRTLSCYLETHKNASILGPRICNADGTIQTSCFHFPAPLHIFLYLSGLYKLIPHIPGMRNRTLQASSASNSARIVPWVLGAALAFRRETFERVGGFDESFFMYFEDVDLSYRLSGDGQQVHFVPEAEIIHVGGASTEQQRASMQLQYFASLEQFYRKHYSNFLLSELVLIVKFFAFLRLARHLLLLQTTRDVRKQSDLRTNLAVDQDLLFGRWNRHANRRSIIPA